MVFHFGFSISVIKYSVLYCIGKKHKPNILRRDYFVHKTEFALSGKGIGQGALPNPYRIR